MNVCAIFKRRKPSSQIFYIYNLIITLCIFLKFISSNKFVYWFERITNSEIKFYREAQQPNINLEGSDVIYRLVISYSSDEKPMELSDHVFTYENTNFISFEVLKSLFDSNTSKNQCGKIECNFELEYILRMTKDISALPDTVNYNHFESLLIVLKYLKAVADKNLSQLLQRFIMKICNSENFVDSTKADVRIEEVFCKNIFFQSELSVKKTMISAYLNILMLKHVFCDENLIILSNKNEIFDTSLFNKHIPYKNLLINDYKAFCILEYHFKSPKILDILKILLNEINIKSLIFYNFLNYRTTDINFGFLKYLTDIFKSLIVFKPLGVSQIIYFELNKVFDLNLEFFTLRKLFVDRDTLIFFFNKQTIKGLILDNITLDVDIDYFQKIFCLSEKLEYIEFKNIEMPFIWWIEFLQKSNIRKIILSFNSRFVTTNFIYEWCKIEFHPNVLYLEIAFCYFEICREFWDSLWYFKYLQTLKLFDYESNKKTELCVFRAIKNMKDLENLSINNDFLSNDFFIFLFKKQGIKILHLNNSYFKRQTLNLEITNNYKSLNEIILKNIYVSKNTLKEIFKLESLSKLSFQFCDLKSKKSTEYLVFMSKNIKKLYLMGSVVKVFEDLDIFAGLEYLEKLQILGRKIYSCSLSNINLLCNSTLKSISYRSGILNLNNLNRLKLLKVLEELDICECEFSECCFYQLGKDCMFLNSLKYLNLSFVRINLTDFAYLNNFKNLIFIELSYSGVPLIQLKFTRISSQKCHFFTKETCDEKNARNLSKRFMEDGIEGIYLKLV
ncbi:hypothetical protein CWI38_1394p0010 [Hamiltosporidium tvaerminnensis]|uniref:Uncharacterized protein n=1 Tax=Hamiltosporidium tvaerminnensis TaxID=1176355 RepID=A0A4Q9LRM1_9MICR|nr:hypothetical protein CWI38_1394p0010 [Hamiltosporidium tvaerminnensis]